MPGLPSVWLPTSVYIQYFPIHNWTKQETVSFTSAHRSKGVTWNITWAKLLSRSNSKRPDIPMGVPLPPTLSGNLSLESAYFLIRGPLPRSPLTLSPHKCVTSSIAFLFKKMFCPPWLCILETLSLSQNKGVHLLNQLLWSGSGTPRPVIGPGITRRIPVLREGTDSVVVLNPRARSSLKTCRSPGSIPNYWSQNPSNGT